MAQWAEQAPLGFCCAVKVGRYGTHRKKLRDAAVWLPNHLDRVRGLGPHLGPQLLQLPPRWRRDVGRLDEVLFLAPRELRWAVEVRDPSWLHDDVFACLKRHDAALCLHDLLPDHPWERTADWAYVRFHGLSGRRRGKEGDVTGDLPPEDPRRSHERLLAVLEAASGEEQTAKGRAFLQELSSAVEELRIQAERLATSVVAIDRQRQRYAELFDFAPDAYVETDEMGKVIEGNQAASNLLGVTVRQMPGKLLVSHVHADERGTFRHLLADVVEGAAAGEHIFRMHSRSGRPVVAGVSAARHLVAGAGSVQVRWLIRDITDRAKLQDQVSELSEEVVLLTGLTGIQQVVQGGDPLTGTLQRIIDLAQRTLPDCEIGVSLAGRSDMKRSLSTGPRARDLDERQRQAGDGPCIEALRSRAVVRGRPEEWPALAGVADVSEILSVPVATADGIDGALNVYALRGQLDDRSLHLLLLLAEQCSVALENARLLASSIALAGGLERAMETRAVIEQAKGILMVRQGCGPEEAFDLLRRASQRENVKLHQIATRLAEAATAAVGVPEAEDELTVPRPPS